MAPSDHRLQLTLGGVTVEAILEQSSTMEAMRKVFVDLVGRLHRLLLDSEVTRRTAIDVTALQRDLPLVNASFEPERTSGVQPVEAQLAHKRQSG